MVTRFNKSLENRFVTLSGPGSTDIYCIGARIRDRLSMIPELRMEFFSTDAGFDPQNVLGKDITLTTDNGFKFSGMFISVEELGHSEADVLFSAEIRPWLWLMTIGANNKVFQGKTTIEIVKEVFQSAGFTHVKDKTTGTYQAREYCVQYGESNFAFISRLLEEEGIYYFFDHSGQFEEIVLGDSVSAHTDKGSIPFVVANNFAERASQADSIFSWTETGRVVPGKVSLFDYDPTKPKTDLKVTASLPSGNHANNQVEVYHPGGHYLTAEDGEAIARKEAEGFAAASARAKGLTNHPHIATGAIFTLDHADRSAANGAYLATGTTHYMLGEIDAADAKPGDYFHPHVEKIAYPKDMVFFMTEFEVQKSSVQYRPRRVSPWPEVPSLLTAIVTGPDGDEIHTDEYGRIKVMFPWDRLGSGKDDTSCWVRTVMPWTGKDWGWQSIPRIGMEVIIQFERGNIDRPYCTGMVYNGINKPPYPLPGEMTKTGLRTNSSKGGGGFHELTFDDKKDAEKVFFQSEKDYEQIIKNNATITIGMEKQDEGSLTQTIYKNKTETIKEGDLTQTVEKGNRITKVKTDDTTTVEGKSTTEITGDTAFTVKTGNLTEKVSTGNASMEVSTGNLETKVSLGNITIEASAGKVVISAVQGIELKVGANSLKIDMAGVTVSGTMVTLDGKAMTEVKGPLVMVKGSAMTQVSGAVVMVG